MPGVVTSVIRVASGILVHPERPGEILMGLRPEGRDRPHLWEFPGGKLELGEGPRDAVERELWEEIGVRVESGDQIATGMVTCDVRVLIYLYEVMLQEGHVPAVGVGSCHQELRWVDPAYAVRHLPCSPGFYEHFEFLMLWLGDRAAGRR